MGQKSSKSLEKSTYYDLPTVLGAKGLPLILGKSITRLDDAQIDPALLITPGVHDIMGASYLDYPAALFFAFRQAARAQPSKPILICESESLGIDLGFIYAPSLAWLGIDLSRLIIVRTKTERELLWSAEEALGCGALRAVIICLPALRSKYTFTASRRLQLRSLISKTPAYVVRASNDRGATSAETLWRIGSAPSTSRYSSKRILGIKRWHAALERARISRPKEWVVDWDYETDHIDMASSMGDGSLLSRAS